MKAKVTNPKRRDVHDSIAKVNRLNHWKPGQSEEMELTDGQIASYKAAGFVVETATTAAAPKKKGKGKPEGGEG